MIILMLLWRGLRWLWIIDCNLLLWLARRYAFEYEYYRIYPPPRPLAATLSAQIIAFEPRKPGSEWSDYGYTESGKEI